MIFVQKGEKIKEKRRGDTGKAKQTSIKKDIYIYNKNIISWQAFCFLVNIQLMHLTLLLDEEEPYFS